MSKTKRYEFTGVTIEYHGKTLKQIRALVNINLLTDAGDVGGYIESEANLPQDGTGWVSGTAKVFDNAVVLSGTVGGDAKVYGNADVLGTARIHGSSIVTDHAVVHGNADVAGCVRIDGYASVCFEVSSPEDFVVYKNILRNEEYFSSSTKRDIWSIGRISKKTSEIEKYFSHRNEKEQKYIMKVVGTHKKMFRL